MRRMSIDNMIAVYKGRLTHLSERIDALHERYGDDLNVEYECGGNYEDAYDMGEDHGSLFAEHLAITTFLMDLENVKEDDK